MLIKITFVSFYLRENCWLIYSFAEQKKNLFALKCQCKIKSEPASNIKQRVGGKYQLIHGKKNAWARF